MIPIDEPVELWCGVLKDFKPYNHIDRMMVNATLARSEGEFPLTYDYDLKAIYFYDKDKLLCNPKDVCHELMIECILDYFNSTWGNAPLPKNKESAKETKLIESYVAFMEFICAYEAKDFFVSAQDPYIIAKLKDFFMTVQDPDAITSLMIADYDKLINDQNLGFHLLSYIVDKFQTCPVWYNETSFNAAKSKQNR